jgi:outer membrane protein OmpA-like peptidoglycan-associated protein
MFLTLLAIQAASTAACPDGRPVQDAGWSCPVAVFFDSGNSDQLRSEWLQVLDGVAQGASGRKVRLDSYSDRSGPARVNLRVSQQRAAAVLEAMVQRGVPAASITVVAHGEAEPLVPTPDGVREPQNRRVDITVLP